MKRTSILLAGALALGLAGFAVAAQSKAPASKTITLKGEVLDMDCYMNEGAHGKDHASCTVMCLNEGAPVGLLATDGKAYFLTANEAKGMKKHYQDVRGWGGDQVSITGVLQVRNGLTSLRIDDAKQL